MQTASTGVNTANFDKQISYRFFFFMSFLIWLIATLVLRFWGQTFFIPESNVSMVASFLFSLFFLPPLAYSLFHWQNVKPMQRRDAAICLAIPGMLLDVMATYFFPYFFPNMSNGANGAFGAWLLWGYAIVLMTGLLTSQWKNR